MLILFVAQMLFVMRLYDSIYQCFKPFDIEKCACLFHSSTRAPSIRL